MLHIKTAVRQLIAVLALALPYVCHGEMLALEKKCLRDTATNCALYGHWLKREGVLYMEEQGRIYTANLRSTERELLVDHGLRYITTFELAPRGDHILYAGDANENDWEVYIYNSKYRTEIKMPGVGSVEFSPDGRYAVQVNMPGPAIDKHLVLIDLEKGNFETTVLASPIEVGTLGDYRRSEVKWALDSNKFYLGMYAFPERTEYRSAAKQREIDKIYKASGASGFCRYFVYELAKRKFKRISGTFVRNQLPISSREGLHYIENGREVQVYSPRR